MCILHVQDRQSKIINFSFSPLFRTFLMQMDKARLYFCLISEQGESSKGWCWESNGQSIMCLFDPENNKIQSLLHFCQSFPDSMI